jgi:hypothetical protein
MLLIDNGIHAMRGNRAAQMLMLQKYGAEQANTESDVITITFPAQ